MEPAARMRKLVDRLNETAQAYYTQGNFRFPTCNGMQCMTSWQHWKSLRALHWKILQRIVSAAHPSRGSMEHRHITRLWSMDKVQSIGALEDWVRRTEKLAGRTDLQYYVEYKFDGLTLNLTYRDGKLVQAATRGNGEVGEAILPQARTVRTVPLSIPYKGLLEVQGECIMRLSVLAEYNKTAKEP